VYDFGNQNKDDPFQFDFCKSSGFAFVTLDTDLMNDSRYPFGRIPGIITIKAKGNSLAKIRSGLRVFIDFILQLPLPKSFLAESRFQASKKAVS
jgi:predicted nuclease of predicted toxin-antitoxin system